MKNTANNQNQNAVIARSTALLIAAGCLIAGFFLGIVFNSNFESKTKVRKMTVKQTESQNFSPNPNTQSPPPSPQLTGAISELEKTVAEDPKNAEAWAKLGHIYFDNNDPAKAIGAYQKYLELNPDNADVWTDMGIMYRSMGNSSEAIRCFDKAIAINPRHPQSRYNKGVVLMHDMQNPEAAVKAWEELVEVFPDAKTQDGRSLKELIKNFKTTPPQPQ